MPKRKSRIEKNIIVDEHKFRLEIYLALEGHQEISWEIFPEDHNAALYAFSNKEQLDKTIKENYIYEK